MTDAIHALSPLDGRYQRHTQCLQPFFSEFGLIHHRVIVEVRWLMMLSEQSAIDAIPPLKPAQTDYLTQLMDNFDTDAAMQIKRIEQTTNHDVKAVEYYLQTQLEQGPDLTAYIPFIHFGCTSADINNVAYALMLQTATHTVINDALATIQSTLDQMATSYADIPMLARTHGQPATPTTLGKECRNIERRLDTQLNQLRHHAYCAKFNGAVGNFNAHVAALPEIDWPAISADFLQSLGLTPNQHTAQIEPHDTIAELMHILCRINTILIDLARDIWGYIALNYFTQAKVEGEVGSSTMPHKVNPIDFENAEGNLGMAIALAEHMGHKLPISRWQRDLTDSTVMRSLGTVYGYSLVAYRSLIKGLNKLEVNRDVIEGALSTHWEVLAEPIQTVLRYHGVADAYEQLKSLTRGTAITKETIHAFIHTLDLPDTVKAELLRLTPTNYLGVAVDLAQSQS